MESAPYVLKYQYLQPRSQSSSAILDVTSPSGHSDSANWPGYEADFTMLADDIPDQLEYI